MTWENEALRGETEELLARVWQELLRVDRVGRHDNFFELGGDSCLLAEMMQKLRLPKLSVGVHSVYQSPTLAALACSLDSHPAEELAVPPNLIEPGCPAITPQMLPLVSLELSQIERIMQAVPGGAANVQDIYPLTPFQEGILFHHLLLAERRSDAYVLSTLLGVSSREKMEGFLSGLQQVIDRHDVLRTSVVWEGVPRPVQVVHRRVALVVKELDWDPDRDLREWMGSDQQMAELRRAPLMHVHVVADAHGAQCYVLLQIHHLVCDPASLETMFAEVMECLEGRGQVLPRCQGYRNHVVQVLTHTRTHEVEAFFRGKLRDIDEPTAPFGLLDVHGDGSRIEEAGETLGVELARNIRVQARRLSVSTATLFHAAWALVVAQTTGRSDVVYGTVLRLQDRAAAHRMLGSFINALPLRLQLKKLSVQELVEQTQRELAELLGHEQASLAIAQCSSGIAKPAPLFTALLNYVHGTRGGEAQWPNSAGVKLLASRHVTNYPIVLSVKDLGDDGLVLQMQTNRLIDPHRMLGYVITAMQSLVEVLEQASRTPALSLSILPEEERQQILQSFNTTELLYAPDRLIHELFEEQVCRTPEGVAVLHGEQQLTYAELNDRANQLARYLLNQGVGPEQLVGICVERSLEMVVGLLAILKAGGAYVPLDPSYPMERLQYMLEDAAPLVVLTQKALRPLLPGTSATLIELDEIPGKISSYGIPKGNLPAAELRLTSNSLLYVIYTSGSTGRPKGAAMAHRSMVNLIEWHRKTLTTFKGQRVLQFAALSFDVAFQETFSTLCTGGTLVLVDGRIRKNPWALTNFLILQSVHRIFVPPLALQSLAECFKATGQIPRSLQDVITAGEQLRISPEIVSFFQELSACRLHNHYGPTETHVVTTFTLSANPEEWPMLPAIGRPISNIQIYVLDGQQQPAPIGVVGEIYIGGVALARGYLRRPELTSQRFIQDPFAGDPRARLYRTGDLGRWRADGTLEYLGRNDHQVKIRGYRIEPGEIEAQLLRHPEVKEAVVVPREDIPGQKRLVAYVIPRSRPVDIGRIIEAHELRVFLKSVLPEHMVPSAFVILDHLPLMPSGKVDRRALAAPVVHEEATRPCKALQGSVEELLGEIWQELLGAHCISRDDNFFELGGDSLASVKLIARLSESFGVRLPVLTVFQYPTVREMAARIEMMRSQPCSAGRTQTPTNYG